jgi:chromosome segregation ATPase
MKRTIMALCAFTLGLTACSSKNGDPRQGGLMGGLQGIYSGGYDKRIEERNGQLVSQQSLHQDLELESVALTKKYQLTDAKLAAEKQNLVELEKGLISLEVETSNNRTQSARQQKEAAKTKNRIVQLQKNIREQHNAIDDLDRTGGSAADPARYQALQSARDFLGGQYKALLDSSQVNVGTGN